MNDFVSDIGRGNAIRACGNGLLKLRHQIQSKYRTMRGIGDKLADEVNRSVQGYPTPQILL